jgi:DNA-binding winged helix-turn-helix (wHTH) protein/DNA-binding CsgD family transcriptional regulator
MQQEWSYEFAPFLLDVRNRVLVKHREPIHVPAKSFDVLVELVRANGRVVTKDHLMDRVWSYTAVMESNIYQSIYRLRCVLRENTHEPIDRYIVNVSGTGYRFATAVRQLSLTGTSMTRASMDRHLAGVRPAMHSAVVATIESFEKREVQAESGLTVLNMGRHFGRNDDQERANVASTSGHTQGTDGDDFLRWLTPTERRVLRLIAESRTSRDIAVELSSSIRTIESHRASIRAKLRLSGSNALVWFAVKHLCDIRRESEEC